MRNGGHMGSAAVVFEGRPISSEEGSRGILLANETEKENGTELPAAARN